MITFYFIASFRAAVWQQFVRLGGLPFNEFFLIWSFFVSISSTASFGGNHLRQRRETTKKPSQEDLLLVQSIQITDKFGFDKQQQSKSNSNHLGYDANETVFIASDATSQGFCVNAIGKYNYTTLTLSLPP